jgi:hypothetical protein
VFNAVVFVVGALDLEFLPWEFPLGNSWEL